LKAAGKDFEEHLKSVQSDMLDAITIAADGGKSDKSHSMVLMVVYLKLRLSTVAMLSALSTRTRRGWFASTGWCVIFSRKPLIEPSLPRHSPARQKRIPIIVGCNTSFSPPSDSVTWFVMKLFDLAPV